MRKDLLGVALGLTLATTAWADVVSMPEGTDAAVAKPAIKLPAKGATMAEVQKQYGEPHRKQHTVGGDAPKHPPITRWDYKGFSVIFEKDRVIDAVIPGAPPKLFHKDQLEQGPVAHSAAPADLTPAPDVPGTPAAAPGDTAPAQPESATPEAPSGTEPPAEKVSPQVHEAPAPAPAP